MSGTGAAHELAVRGSITGWADVVEVYEPVVMQSGTGSVRRPQVSVRVVANPAARLLTIHEPAHR